MPKYWVTFALDTRYTTVVEANSIEDAKNKAECNFMEANVGDLEIVDTSFVTIEDEAGNYYDR